MYIEHGLGAVRASTRLGFADALLCAHRRTTAPIGPLAPSPPWSGHSTAGWAAPLACAVRGAGLLLLTPLELSSAPPSRSQRNFAALSRHFRVYALDLLGQGGSWPGDLEVDPDPELGPLMYRWAGGSRAAAGLTRSNRRRSEHVMAGWVCSKLHSEAGCRQLQVLLRGTAGSSARTPAYTHAHPRKTHTQTHPRTRGTRSAEMWTRQLQEFLRDVAGAGPESPAYVAGNSLGGFLAVNLAATHPGLVKGLVLLNASGWPRWLGFWPAAWRRCCTRCWGWASGAAPWDGGREARARAPP